MSSTCRLKNITTKIGSGATPRGGKNSYKKNGISLIRSMNVYDFKFKKDGLAYIDEKQARLLDNVKVESKDILLNITGASVARCCIVPNSVLPARVNQHVSIVRCDPQKADAGYILYSLNSYNHKTRLLNIAQGGATREALTKERIEEFEIPLPSLHTQQKIASILSAYDDLIENNSRRIKILEEMAQNIYKKWFVNFNFPGYEKVKFVDSSLGKIPEGWEVVNLVDVASVDYGYPFNSSEFCKDPTGKPVIRIRDIKNNKTQTFTFEEVDEKYKVKNGDIIIGMDGDFFMGKWAGGEAWLNQRNARVRPKSDVSKYYLLHCLVEPINFFDSTIVGTTVAHLSKRDFDSIKIMIPLNKILRDISEILDPIYEEEIILLSKNENLRKTRDLLLPKLMSGEVEV